MNLKYKAGLKNLAQQVKHAQILIGSGQNPYLSGIEKFIGLVLRRRIPVRPGPNACTTGKIIFLPPQELTEEGKLVYLGKALHEVSHILVESDFEHFKKVQTELHGALKARLINTTDDIRVEMGLQRMYPQVVETTRPYWLWKEAHVLADLNNLHSDDLVNVIMNLCVLFIARCRFKQLGETLTYQAPSLMLPTYDTYFADLEDEACAQVVYQDSVDLAFKLYERIKDLIRADINPPAPPSAQEGNEEEPQQGQGGGSNKQGTKEDNDTDTGDSKDQDSNGDSGDSGDEDDGTSKDAGGSGESSDGDQGDSNNNDSSGQDAPPDEDSNDAAGSGDTSEGSGGDTDPNRAEDTSDPSDEGSSDGSESGSGSGSSDTSSDDPNEGSESGSSDTSDEKSDEETREGGENTSDSEEPSEDSAKQGTGSSDDDSNGDDPEAHGDDKKSNDDPGDESEEESKDGSEENSSEAGEDEEGKPDDEEIERQVTDKLTYLNINSSMIKTPDNILTDNLNKVSDGEDFEYIKAPETKDLIKDGYEGSIREAWMVRQAGIALLGKCGRDMIRHFISQTKPRIIRRMDAGRFDTTTFLKDRYRQDVFNSKIKGTLDKAVLAIALDNSSSMIEGSRAYTASKLLSGILYHSDKNGIPTLAAGYTIEKSGISYKTSTIREYPVRIDVIKRFEERYDDKVMRRCCPLPDSYRSGTPDLDCLRWLTPQLWAREEDKKVLFVICDGEPTAHGNDLSQKLRVSYKRYIEACKLAGIRIFGFGIGADISEYFGDDWVHVTSTSLAGTFVERLRIILNQK